MCGKGNSFCYVLYLIEIDSGIQTYLIVRFKCVVTGLIIYCFKQVRENFRLGRDFPPVQTGSGAHPASCKMGTGSFPGVKCGRGVLLTTHPLLVPRSWKSKS